MSDTTTKAVERIARGIETTLTKRLGLGPHVKSTEADTLRALAAERDTLKAENERMARIVLAAAEALKAIDAYTNTPTDRGGKAGPKGQAREARDAAIERLRKAVEGGE